MKRILLFLPLFLLACSIEKKLAPLEPTPFLSDVDIKKKMPNLPFEHSWVKDGLTARSYDKIFVKPVRLDYLQHEGWQKSISPVITSREDFEKEAKTLGDYFRETLIADIKNHPQNHYQIVDAPLSGGLVLEFAMTELEFSHPAAQAGSLVSPIPGTGVAVAAISDPRVGFAGRLTDGQSGELLASVAQRKFSPLRIIDFNKFTVTSSNREICANFAKIIASSLNTKPGTVVEGDSRISLLPW